MKKLVTAACALVAASAFAVESANTVGYVDNDGGVSGYNWACGPFGNVGGNGFGIQNIVLDDGGEGLIFANALQVLDEDAYTDEMYFYNEVGDGVYEWQDENDLTADRVFGSAEGFLIEGLEDITLRFVGEVPSQVISFTGTTTGYTWMGNPYPAAIDIQDVSLDDDGEGLIFSNALQVLDPDAYTDEMYFYNEVGDGVFEWQDENDTRAVRSFAAGEGFLIEGIEDIECSIAKPYNL